MRLPTERFLYFLEAELGEEVCFHVTPVSTAGTFEVVGAECEGPAEHPSCCFVMPQRFHAVLFQFVFNDGDPDSARFDVRITGSECGDVKAPSIRKSQKSWKRAYNFEEVEDSCS